MTTLCIARCRQRPETLDTGPRLEPFVGHAPCRVSRLTGERDRERDAAREERRARGETDAARVGEDPGHARERRAERESRKRGPRQPARPPLRYRCSPGTGRVAGARATSSNGRAECRNGRRATRARRPRFRANDDHGTRRGKRRPPHQEKRRFGQRGRRGRQRRARGGRRRHRRSAHVARSQGAGPLPQHDRVRETAECRFRTRIEAWLRDRHRSRIGRRRRQLRAGSLRPTEPRRTARAPRPGARFRSRPRDVDRGRHALRRAPRPRDPRP